MQYSIVKYRHFGNCILLTNGTVELVASLDFGPRILKFCLAGCENLFYEQPAEADYLCTPDGWRLYGGSRLLFAPEARVTYWPDNSPIAYEILENGIRFTRNYDEWLKARKSIELRFTDAADTVSVRYEVTNVGKEVLEGAPWAISSLCPGGVLCAPFAELRAEATAASLTSLWAGATPTRFLSMWNDTRLNDERLTFGDDCLSVRHLPVDNYFKLGLLCRQGTASYTANGQVFTKRFDGSSQSAYPDGNVNLEIWCGRQMLEVESLAPLTALKPGETAAHEETWSVCHQ